MSTTRQYWRPPRSVATLQRSWLCLAIGFFVWNSFLLVKIDQQEAQKKKERRRHLRVSEPGTINNQTSVEQQRLPLLPASIWATRQLPHDVELTNITALLTTEEKEKSLELCGKFLYSTLSRAVHLKNMGEDVFVATGDIDSMWVRDSVVQMTIYLKHVDSQPWLRFIIDGTIRRNAFNILQDPYANAYEHHWKDPSSLDLRDQVIGRGGFVATRNYELDSGAYFLNHLYDYYMAPHVYRPELVLLEPMVFEAVMTMINTWIVEQRHEELSPYRYYELPREGKGTLTNYTGMTWSGFRPSDDPCVYGYLVPANIHAAAALQRVLVLNDRIWRDKRLARKASKLLNEIEEGIEKFGIVQSASGEPIYAYEVDGRGKALINFDDANVPSLLSIPLLGWQGYSEEVYNNTRKHLLSLENKQYREGDQFRGIGSPHTSSTNIWPMAMVVQGLTEKGHDHADKMAFQLRQLLKSATKDAMHESVHKDNASRFTREWFEWANALFVIYVETVLRVSCAPIATDFHKNSHLEVLKKKVDRPHATTRGFYKPTKNDHWNPLFYQNIEAYVQFE